MPKSPANAKISMHDADPDKGETPSSKTGRYRGLIGLLILALLSYAISLAATAPASLVTRLVKMPPAVTSLSGSVWHGQAMLVGGHIARWSVMPLASLGQAALVAQWSLQGPGTQLQGNARLRTNGASVNGVGGRASWRLIAALGSTLPIACEAQARVAIEQAAFGETLETLEGELRSGPAVCAATNATSAQPVEVPPLQAVATTTADGVRVDVTTAAEATLLARATLNAQNTLVLTLMPAGARLVPGMPTSGETILEVPL